MHCRLTTGSRDGLGEIRKFRFPDPLIWVMIVGIVLVLAGEWGVGSGRVGANLVAFMGGLYIFRGAGVILSLTGSLSWLGSIALLAGVIFASPFLLATAMMVGLSDSWFDLRARLGGRGDGGAGESGADDSKEWKMKVILKQTVESLGETGKVVSVKPGYARNYLLPQGLAYEASESNLRKIEEEQKLSAERARRDYLEAKRRASQLDEIVLTFQARASEEGKLFGSITSLDIVERLNAGKLDFEVDRRQLLLEDHLKELGVHQVPIKLFADVTVEIEVRVDREAD
jgi:large subunit ribosomal protein L9